MEGYCHHDKYYRMTSQVFLTHVQCAGILLLLNPLLGVEAAQCAQWNILRYLRTM